MPRRTKNSNALVPITAILVSAGFASIALSEPPRDSHNKAERLQFGDTPPPEVGGATPEAFDQFLSALRVALGTAALEHYLERIDYHAEKLGFSNEQIDRLIAEVRNIQATDAYQEAWWGKVRKKTPENARWVYVNRVAAAEAIERLQHWKIANNLRALPLDQRIDRIFEFVEGRKETGGRHVSVSRWFADELRRIGVDAVPYILSHAPDVPAYRLTYARVLSRIGDPRAIDFIVAALHEAAGENHTYRCELITALGGFSQPAAIDALIDAMHDQTRLLLHDVNPRQRPGGPAHIPRPAWCYPIRDCTERALRRATNANWGLLFSRDPLTWSAWLKSVDKPAFDPLAVPRTDEELRTLLRDFTYKCMREILRMESWDEHRQGASSQGQQLAQSLAPALRKRGPAVVPGLTAAYRSISEEFPVWKPHLRRWTRYLLEAINTQHAQQAVRDLSR